MIVKSKLNLPLIIILLCTLTLFYIIYNNPFKNKYINIYNPFKSNHLNLSVKQMAHYYKNDDIIGTINIDGTNIKKPFVQTSNNDFYMNHNLYKENSIFGSIFMDYQNHFTDKQILLYGHNGNHVQSPFFELKNFKNENFYKYHKFIQLNLSDRTLIYEIFTVSILQNTNKHLIRNFKSETQFLEYISFLKQNQIYKIKTDISSKNQILLLQTCTYEKENSYLVIGAKKIKEKKYD